LQCGANAIDIGRLEIVDAVVEHHSAAPQRFVQA